MSRIGKKPILIPDDVKVEIGDSVVKVSGPKGELQRKFRNDIKISIKDSTVVLEMYKKNKLASALWGTYASHIANMIEGVKNGYEKRLLLEGVGYRAELQGKDLSLNLGFSHPVKIEAPEGITFKTEKNMIIISGIDKEKVGQIAAQIRALKKPEPYKGKGIRYEDEVVRRKAGKKAVGTQ